MSVVRSSVRVRGCAAPFSREQLFATSLQLCTTALTLAFLGVYACGGGGGGAGACAAPLVLYSTAAVVVLACWSYCVFTDPAQPGGVRCARMAATQAETRWCRACGKSVPGLDHHCPWLNTCVGTRNYVFFLALVFTAVAQHTLGVLAAVLTPTVWFAPGVAPFSVVSPAVFGAIVGVLAVTGLAAFGSLAAFHVYLLSVGLGTFDWMVARRARAMEGDVAPPAAAAEAAAPRLAPVAAAVPAELEFKAVAVAPAAAGAGGSAGGAPADPPAAAPPAAAAPSTPRDEAATEAAAMVEAESGQHSLEAAHARVQAAGPGGSSSLFAALAAQRSTRDLAAEYGARDADA